MRSHLVRCPLLFPILFHFSVNWLQLTNLIHNPLMKPTVWESLSNTFFPPTPESQCDCKDKGDASDIIDVKEKTALLSGCES